MIVIDYILTRNQFQGKATLLLKDSLALAIDNNIAQNWHATVHPR